MTVIKMKPKAKAKREKRFSRKDMAAHWMLLLVKNVSFLKTLMIIEYPTEDQLGAAVAAIDDASFIANSYLSSIDFSEQDLESFGLKLLPGHLDVLQKATDPGDADPIDVFNACRRLIDQIDDELGDAQLYFGDLTERLYRGGKQAA